MFKKLSNLLFEEEEIEDEVNLDEEDSLEVDNTIRKPKKQPVFEAPVEKPAMQRIDVEPTVREESAQDSVFARPTAVQHASPRPIAKEPEPVVEKPKSLGITVDEITPAANKPVAPRKPQPKSFKKKDDTPKASVYEFRPVISPMFGVDEKDMDAVATTAKFVKSSENDASMSKIISPMYGQSEEAQPTRIQPTVEKSNELEDLTVNTESKKAEDDIPAFSLDDILNARDEEFKREAEEDAFEDSEVIDETVVFDTDAYASSKKKGKGE